MFGMKAEIARLDARITQMVNQRDCSCHLEDQSFKVSGPAVYFECTACGKKQQGLIPGFIRDLTAYDKKQAKWNGRTPR